MTIQELHTKHQICDLEGTQSLNITAMFVQSPNLAGYLLTGNRSNFIYVEGSITWLYDFLLFVPP